MLYGHTPATTHTNERVQPTATSSMEVSTSTPSTSRNGWTDCSLDASAHAPILRNPPPPPYPAAIQNQAIAAIVTRPTPSVHFPRNKRPPAVTTDATVYSSPKEVPAEDPLYPTRDEALLATALFHYGPGNETNFPDEFDFCVKMGALTTSSSPILDSLCVAVVPVVLANSSEDGGDKGLEEGSAVGNAERLIERASEVGNFDSLWALTFKVFEVQRKEYQEGILGITAENTTISAELAAVKQLYRESVIAWAARPVMEETAPATNSNPWVSLNIPRLTVPQLGDSINEHALWYFLHAHPKANPGITYIRSGHVDLATINPMPEWIRQAKRSFTEHFVHLAIIPYMYGQCLQQLELTVNATYSIIPSNSRFNELEDVVTHLAACGVSVPAMGSALYFGLQYASDIMSTVPLGSEKWIRYRDLAKRGIAHMQFCQPLQSDDRYWKLPEAYSLADVLEDRRRRFTIARKRDAKILPIEEYWKFGRRSGITAPVFTSTVTSITNGMAALSLV
ncbi:hypothetical protein GYMLUDRAFT_988453 [Collybiopsis luxurians FD-317 M1]|uniref:Uncharacterized protein n=1 Tax=Collybiopsis luxurians FD-317 M1 TaxID=944289 RepID=A0A0D0BHT9_9AGAR|nr:hypothetical protein GYMLUDRAFT_988453 [Collybiopsis luxurians FD-317 M1]